MVDHFEGMKPAVPAPSLALVNKVVQHLREQAFLEALVERGFRVKDYEGLLRAWREAWRPEMSVRRRYFTLLQGRALGERLRAFGAEKGGRVAYGVFSAAEIQAPYVRQARTWIYAGREEESALVEAVEGKRVESGENLVVLIAGDEGVFYGLDEAPERLACTNAVQTYMDVAHAGGRGEEAAEAVLRQQLRVKWERGKDGTAV